MESWKVKWNALLVAGSIVFLILYAINDHGHWLIITMASLEIALAVWNFIASLYLNGRCTEKDCDEDNQCCCKCDDMDGCGNCTQIGVVTLNVSFLFWFSFLMMTGRWWALISFLPIWIIDTYIHRHPCFSIFSEPTRS